MTTPARTVGARRRETGLTLVELMVAMVIGVGLLAGVLTVYTESSNAYQVAESSSRLQETANYALGVLEPDIRMAGYWGLFKGGATVVNSASQTAPTSGIGGAAVARCGKNFAVDLTTVLEGQNDTYGLACAAYNSNPMQSGDTLTIRRAATTTTTVPSATAGPLRVCTDRVSATVVNVAPVASCPVAPAGQVSDLFVNTYYIDNDSVNSVGKPALRLLSLTGPTVLAPDFVDSEVVSGVEDLQVQFGIDPTGTTCQATQYVDALPAGQLPANFGQIVAVRIWVLVRADNPEIGFVDNTTYQYANRSTANGTTSSLNAASARGKAYRPNDNFRRMLVSRTIMIRNAVGC